MGTTYVYCMAGHDYLAEVTEDERTGEVYPEELEGSAARRRACELCITATDRCDCPVCLPERISVYLTVAGAEVELEPVAARFA